MKETGWRIRILVGCVAALLASCGSSAHPRSVSSLTSSSTRPSASSLKTLATVPATGSIAPGQATTTLAGIAFFNPTQGYGLFEQRPADGSDCKSLVAKTTDAGAHFAALGTIDTWSCQNNPNASFLSFDNHGDGFVYAPKLFVTHDDGQSWSPQSQPGTVTAVSALGYSVWMLEGVCPPGESAPGNTCGLRLLESADGGRTWAPSPSPVPKATVGSGALTVEPALGQSWLLRASRLAAYVVSNPTPNPNGSPDSVPFWYTADEGSTWTAGAIPCGIDAMSAAVSLAPDGALAAVCAGEPSAGMQFKSTSISTDGGRTWRVHRPCADVVGSAPPCGNAGPVTGYLGNIDALSGNTIFLVGGRSSLLVTRDGGSDWNPVLPLIGGTEAGTGQVIFFDPHNGVVLGTDTGTGERAIWSTNDSGVAWSKTIPDLT